MIYLNPFSTAVALNRQFVLCIFDVKISEKLRGKCRNCKADINIKYFAYQQMLPSKKSPAKSPRKSPIKRNRARIQEMESETTTEEEVSENEPEYESESDD